MNNLVKYYVCKTCTVNCKNEQIIPKIIKWTVKARLFDANYQDILDFVGEKSFTFL